MQKEFKRTEALIRVEDQKTDIYVVHVEVTAEATKDFEDVQVQMDLRTKPTRVTARCSPLDGTHHTLTVVSTNLEGTSYLINPRTLPDSPISLEYRESLEIYQGNQPVYEVTASNTKSLLPSDLAPKEPAKDN